MTGTTRRDLYLQVSGSTDPLRQALKSGAADLLKFGTDVDGLVAKVNERFKDLGNGAVDPKSLTAGFKRQLTELQSQAQNAVGEGLSGSIIDVAGAKLAADRAQEVAVRLRLTAEAARLVAVDAGGANQALNALAASSAGAAGAAEVEARALREQHDILMLVEQKEIDLAEAEGRLTVVRRQAAVANAGVKAGMQQLSFQLNDMATMWAMNAPPMQIFASQAGQVIQALQLVAGESQGFLSVMAGPWGMIITTALVVLTPLVAKLFEADDALKLAKVGSDGLSDAQGVLGKMFDLTSGKLEHQNELLRLNARLTAMNLRAEADKQHQDARDTFGKAGQGSYMGLGAFFARGQVGEEVGAAQRQLMQQIRDGRIGAEGALKAANTMDFSGLKVTREEFKQAIIDLVSAKFKRETADKLDTSIDTGKLDPSFKRDDHRKPKVDHTVEKEANRDAAYQGQLAQANDAYAKAQLKLADNAEARYQIKLAELKEDLRLRNLQIDDQVTAKKLTEAEAKILRAKLAETEQVEEKAALREKEVAQANAAFEAQSHARELELGILEIDLAFANTRQERLAIEREILAAQQKAKRAELDHIVATSNNQAQVAQARKDLADLPRLEDRQRAALEHQEASPLERYKDELRSAVGDTHDALEQVKVNALDRLADGFDKAAAKALGLHGILGDIVSDLIKMEAKKFILSLLDSGTGSGGIFGKIFGGGRATGGGVDQSKFYVVGENGPEIFAPGRSGTIIPNYAIRSPKLRSGDYGRAGAGGGRQLVETRVSVDASPLLEARVASTSARTVAAAAEPIMAGAQQRTMTSLTRRPTPGGVTG